MNKTISIKDLNCFETRFYLVPKEQLCIAIKPNVYDTIKDLEDYELTELTEKEITEKIDEYNQAKENNYFNRLKQKDFLLITAHIQKIGKYKFVNIHAMDYL